MNTKLLINFMILAATFLSACGGPPPAETPTPALMETSIIPVTGATATEAPVTIEPSVTPTTTLTATPESTATPEPTSTRPPNSPDCTNSASFVTDVNIPDNTEMVGGDTFTKTWRVMNTGTCIWASDYTLTHYSEERMNAPASVPLAVTFPGQTVDISIPLTAPNSVGKHQAYFVVKNPAGLIMKINEDSRLWIIINVANLATATAATTQTANGTPATVASGDSGPATGTCAYSIDQARLTEVINAVNSYRAQSGLPAYTVNPQLARAAQSHASDMACNQLFYHKGSDGSTPQSRVAATGYVAAFMTENVYGSYPPLTGQGAVNWWKNDKNDPNHNLNLISDTYTEIGVGYAFFDNYGFYVIVFATP